MNRSFVKTFMIVLALGLAAIAIIFGMKRLSKNRHVKSAESGVE
jgi:hypothetical protein